MGSKELRKRTNWQEVSGEKASVAEQDLYKAFEKEFANNPDYKLIRKPRHLKKLYANVKLSEDLQKSIYNPPNLDLANTEWGVSPDFAIENVKTGKILFGEIKRQDGWVEGKHPNDGRGNAHERLCKLFTVGLQKTYRKIGKVTNPNILPFWVVFEGDITRDPKRVREITFWFDKFNKNFFLWQPKQSDKPLIDHFNKYLKPYLEES